MKGLTAERLREVLHYNPDTGVFTWLWRADGPAQWNTRWVGKVAGARSKAADGRVYLYIGIDGQRFKAHRLAFLYMEGMWPADLIDHEDTDGINNAWRNLREADDAQNQANARRSKANTSGFKGASFCKRSGRFQATITYGGRNKNLGSYDTAEAAHEAYMRAATARSGEYARAA